MLLATLGSTISPAGILKQTEQIKTITARIAELETKQ
jgi:hypothetical protein